MTLVEQYLREEGEKKKYTRPKGSGPSRPKIDNGERITKNSTIEDVEKKIDISAKNAEGAYYSSKGPNYEKAFKWLPEAYRMLFDKYYYYADIILAAVKKDWKTFFEGAFRKLKWLESIAETSRGDPGIFRYTLLQKEYVTKEFINDPKVKEAIDEVFKTITPDLDGIIKKDLKDLRLLPEEKKALGHADVEDIVVGILKDLKKKEPATFERVVLGGYIETFFEHFPIISSGSLHDQKAVDKFTNEHNLAHIEHSKTSTVISSSFSTYYYYGYVCENKFRGSKGGTLACVNITSDYYSGGWG